MVSWWQRLLGGGRPKAARVAPRPVGPRAADIARPAPAAGLVADPSSAPDPVARLGDINEAFHRFVFALPAAATPDTPTSAGAALLKRLELLSTRFDMRSLPRLPTVLPQLLRKLKSDTAAGGELARLVGRDPLMVGEVMRVTSSVFYRSAQPVSSLQQAVVLLGQDGLRRVLTQHAMKPILQTNAGASGHAGEYLWEHAERCAHVCAWLGKRHGSDDFEAYLAGIVCHTGSGAVVRLLSQLLADVPAVAMDASFIHACAALAARLSHQAARHWELPPRVLRALEEREQADATGMSPLGEALAVADVMAMSHLLGQHRLHDDTDLSACWPERFSPTLLQRCQNDLRKHFNDSETANASAR